MELTEVIIRAHAHSHAAELAIQAKNPDAAYRELYKLRVLLADELTSAELPKHESPEPE